MSSSLEDFGGAKAIETSAPCPYNCSDGRIFIEGENGMFPVPCPHCSSLIKSKPHLVTIEEDFRELEIPEQYKGVIPFESDQLMERVYEKGGFSKSSIERVSTYLNRLYHGVKIGEIPRTSTYVYLSNNVVAAPFVYGMQKQAVLKGLKVTPFISLNTLSSIYHALDYDFTGVVGSEVSSSSRDYLLAYEGFKYSKEFNVTAGDFVSADLCILNATAETLPRGWTALADLLAERARRGKATIVFGYWKSTNSGAGSLKYLVSSELDSRNDLLHPVELGR